MLVGNGSNELIQATLAVTVAPGDVVVAPAPTFSLYRLLTAVLGGRYVPVPLADDFQYDVDRLIEVAVRASGPRWWSSTRPTTRPARRCLRGAVERVLARPTRWCCATRRTRSSAVPTAMPLLAVLDRVVVLRTFSKAMGMAGLRFGVGAGASGGGPGDRQGQAARTT